MHSPGDLIEILLAEILRDAHRYAPGVDQRRPVNVYLDERRWLRAIRRMRDHGRDLIERVGGRAGFSHRHFDPELAGERLARVIALSEGLASTYAQLADEHSRRALIEVLKLRVLGPYHTSLDLTPGSFKAKQAYADRRLRVRRKTFNVSGPWFSPLSLYRVPVDADRSITLHTHSVDVVSVLLLSQYGYARGSGRVLAEPGDVVLDIGCSFGDAALYFAHLVGPRGRVYAFEFDPESLEVLHTNLELNPQLAGRIEVVKLAAWDRSGESIPFGQAGRMTRMLPGVTLAEPSVRTITIDDFVADAGIDRLRFVKMDVEGAELNVLRGARGTLERFAPKLAVAAYHRDDDLVRIPQELDSLASDYRLYLQTFSPVEDETVLFAAADSPAPAAP
jgi:FkbM family methyltransferase